MFPWTSEQELLAKTVSDYAKNTLGPRAADVDETEGWHEDTFPSLGALGLLGVTASEEYGGAALGSLEATLIMEKIDRKSVV